MSGIEQKKAIYKAIWEKAEAPLSKEAEDLIDFLAERYSKTEDGDTPTGAQRRKSIQHLEGKGYSKRISEEGASEEEIDLHGNRHFFSQGVLNWYPEALLRTALLVVWAQAHEFADKYKERELNVDAQGAILDLSLIVQDLCSWKKSYCGFMKAAQPELMDSAETLNEEIKGERGSLRHKNLPEEQIKASCKNIGKKCHETLKDIFRDEKILSNALACFHQTPLYASAEPQTISLASTTETGYWVANTQPQGPTTKGMRASGKGK